MPDRPETTWHPLEAHLEAVAKLACEFAAPFSASGWANLAGLWHDLGKFAPEFQEYLRRSNDAHLESKPGRVDHSSAGGRHAVKSVGPLGRVLAYVICGHHAGLPDWSNEHHQHADLEHRLAEKQHLERAQRGEIPGWLLDQPLPTEKAKGGTELSLSLWLRMLFSCLVDADFLDTEAFADPEKGKQRKRYPSLAELLPIFDTFMDTITKSVQPSTVNELRAELLAACQNRATEAPGLFTLTAPTGTGKTLSSLAFALNHAVKHGKRRIIYVIPYTSIVEQTADQFRKIFGNAVVEHHSNLDVDDPAKDNPRSRLACENWDAPLIVTTAVQFFESLFSSRTSRCRKLHNVVNSVVILDEVQLLPPDFLTPVLEAIQELGRNYKVTFVLGTATQPAFTPRQGFEFNFNGLPGLREICTAPRRLHDALRRTRVELIDHLDVPLPWLDLAEKLLGHERVLCIVNRRDDARKLYELLPKKDSYHLSALMCGQHRSEVIAKIKAALASGEPVRVVSTQLIEAGVDLDFPVVYRALAGLDSIAQAAGRCNREGRLELGQVFVFQPDSAIPVGHLRQAAEIGRQLLIEPCGDRLAPERFEHFFRQLFWIHGERLDRHNILGYLRNDSELRISFRSAAEHFHLIDEQGQATVVVLHGEEGARLGAFLVRLGAERFLLRKLQRYTVNVPRRMHHELLQRGAIEEVHPGIYLQRQGGLYDQNLGLCADLAGIFEPDQLIC
ncbi:MAG: CRISPR-associated helicase/endonuclease Cas3 [Deltaproteobacteria bacterium RIFOXYA12_FULL_61_11]|nr:MAG: CRISPR-associated helicase/endonuclease Cas3 [Deltaproteobacteria bacterium RIFOXYA12_FULL_61_11]